jgi:choice-of-anchor A domain-containing protein
MGCSGQGSPPNHENVGEKGEAILNGIEQTADHPGVALAFIGGGTFCGGALVRGDVVITAAHCLDGLNDADLNVCKPVPGTDLCAPGSAVTAEDIYVPPEWVASRGGVVHHAQAATDWALIRLTSSLPGPYASIRSTAADNQEGFSQVDIISPFTDANAAQGFSRGRYSLSSKFGQAKQPLLFVQEPGIGRLNGGQQLQAFTHGGDSGSPWYGVTAAGEASFTSLMGVVGSGPYDDRNLAIGRTQTANLFYLKSRIETQIELMNGFGRCVIGPGFNSISAPATLTRSPANICLRRSGANLELVVAPMDGGATWTTPVTSNAFWNSLLVNTDYQFAVGYHTGQLAIAAANSQTTAVHYLNGTRVVQAKVDNQATITRTHHLGFRNLDGGAAGGAEVIFTNIGEGIVYEIINATTLRRNTQMTVTMTNIDTDEALDYVFFRQGTTGGVPGIQYRVIPTGYVAGGLNISDADIDMDFDNVSIWALPINRRPEDPEATYSGGFLVVTDGAAKVAELDDHGFYTNRVLLWHPTHSYAGGRRLVGLRPSVAHDVALLAPTGALGRAAGVELLVDDGRALHLDYTDAGLQYKAATDGASFPNTAYTGFPTSTGNDGKFLYLGGKGLNTFTDASYHIWVNSRPGSTEPLYVDIYDADMDAFFDLPNELGTCFRLVPDPVPGMDDADVCHDDDDTVSCAGVFHSDFKRDRTGLDGQWWRFYDSSVKAHAPAALQNGIYTYRLDVSLAESCASPAALGTTSGDNGFKVRTNGELFIAGGDFSVNGYDSVGPNVAPVPLTPAFDTDFDGFFDFTFLVETAGEVTLSNADADDPDGESTYGYRAANANGASADTRFDLIGDAGVIDLLTCPPNSTCDPMATQNRADWTLLSGGVEIPSGGYVDATDIVDHVAESLPVGAYSWAWEGLYTNNAFRVAVSGSPVTHSFYSPASEARPAVAVRSLSEWAGAADLAAHLPQCLGAARVSSQCPSEAVNVLDRATVAAIATDGSALAKATLLAKLNASLSSLSGISSTDGRIASSPRLLKDVLVDADQALKQGTTVPAILAALNLANAGRLNFVAAPLGNSAGDDDNDTVANAWDNCRSTDNADQADADSDGTGDACELTPTVSCVYTNADGRHAAFGYVNEGVERRFRVGAHNGFASQDLGQPTHFPTGTTPVAFVAKMTGSTLTWSLNGREAVASTSTPACSQWPAAAPAPCEPGQPVVKGTANAETLSPGVGSFCVLAEAGADTVELANGASTVLGAAGNDTVRSNGQARVYAGSGNDNVTALSGTLYVDGGDGNDTLIGHNGNDTFYPGAGINQVSGGGGDDLIVLSSACDVAPGSVINGGPGTDTLRSTLTIAELASAGVTVQSIETVELLPETQECPPVTCRELLGAAASFNAFVLDDLRSTPNAEGPVAAGDEVSANAFGYNTLNLGGTGAVAGRRFVGSQGTIRGNMFYGETSSLSAVNFIGGSAQQGRPIDFALERDRLSQLSLELGALQATGTIKINPWGTIELRGTNPELNVFELPTAALVGNRGLLFSVPSTSTIIVNVTGTQAAFESTNMDYGAVPDARVLWNFRQATTVRIAQTGFKGSLLAPLASVSHINGSLSGQLIAYALTGTNNGLSSRPFTGKLPLRQCE